MTLQTLDPDPSVDPDSFDQSVLDALAGDHQFKVWGGDWCIDCKQQLPAFGAALDATGVPDDRIESFPVTKGPSGKEGPGVEAYGIERIPTVVVETPDGTEVARFVEEAEGSIAEALAAELADAEAAI